MSIHSTGLSRILQILEQPRRPGAPRTLPQIAPQTMNSDKLTKSAVLKGDRFASDAGLNAVGAGQTTLGQGAVGPSVKAVQQAFVDMAFLIPGGVDGMYGPQTAQSVRNFQQMAGLPQTGVVDQATMKALDRYAPPAGKQSWDTGVNPGPLPDPRVGKKIARVVVETQQHRAFLFDKTGKLTKIYACRSGKTSTPTVPGVKIVDGKNDNPAAVSNALWPTSGGRAFGTRLMNLSDYDPETGRTYLGPHHGEELHGTYEDNSMGQNFSHGCVGLRNADIEEIYNQVANGELVRFDG
ncbi:MAG TPA: L,D-transpeptidase family protein [Oscillatoriaceae cyanobacterium]